MSCKETWKLTKKYCDKVMFEHEWKAEIKKRYKNYLTGKLVRVLEQFIDNVKSV